MNDFLSIFQGGLIVSTRFQDQNGWINNSIIDVDFSNSTVEIHLKKEYVEKEVLAGEQMELRASIDGNMYFAKGKVTDVVQYSPQRMKVKVDSLELIDTNSDKRDNTRYTVKYDCIIKSSYATNNESLQVINVSTTGVRIIGSHQNVPIGENVFVDVFLDNNKVLKLGGKIVRKKINGYDFEYGVNCNPIDDVNQEYLDELLNQLYKRDNEETSYVSVIKRLREKSMSNND